MTREDMVRLLERRAPWLSDILKENTDSYYMMLMLALDRVIKCVRHEHLTESNRENIQAFFDVLEDALAHGDENVIDLVYIEVGHVLYDSYPNKALLAPFFGPRVKKMIEPN